MPNGFVFEFVPETHKIFDPNFAVALILLRIGEDKSVSIVTHDDGVVPFTLFRLELKVGDDGISSSDDFLDFLDRHIFFLIS